jgi:hypothetical protein
VIARISARNGVSRRIVLLSEYGSDLIADSLEPPAFAGVRGFETPAQAASSRS